MMPLGDASRTLAEGWRRLTRTLGPDGALGAAALAGPVVALTSGDGGSSSGWGGPARFRPVLGPRPAEEQAPEPEPDSAPASTPEPDSGSESEPGRQMSDRPNASERAPDPDQDRAAPSGPLDHGDHDDYRAASGFGLSGPAHRRDNHDPSADGPPDSADTTGAVGFDDGAGSDVAGDRTKIAADPAEASADAAVAPGWSPAPDRPPRFGAPADPLARRPADEAAPSFGYRPPPVAPPAAQPPAPAPGFAGPETAPRSDTPDDARTAFTGPPPPPAEPDAVAREDAAGESGANVSSDDAMIAAPAAAPVTHAAAPTDPAPDTGLGEVTPRPATPNLPNLPNLPDEREPAAAGNGAGAPATGAAVAGERVEPVIEPAEPVPSVARPVAPAAPAQSAAAPVSPPLANDGLADGTLVAAPGVLPGTVPGTAGVPSRRATLEGWLARHLSVPGLWVALAVIIGMPMRLLWLATIPPGLNQDEAVSGYDAWSIFQTGRDQHGHPISLAGLESFGDWSSPLLTFLTVPFVGVFGLHLGTIRLVSALIGLAVIPVLYFLGKELTGQRAIGVVAAWVIALLPIAIHISRWAIPPTTVPLLVPLTMLALVWALRRRSGAGLIVAAAVGGIAVAGYPSLKVYLPLLAAAILVIYLPDLLVTVRRAAWQVIAALAVVVITAGPVLWMGSRDPGGRARADQVSALNNPDFGARQLFDAYRSYFSPGFLFTHGDGDPMHSPPGFGVLPPVLLPFMLIGLVALIVRVLAPQGPGNRQRSLVILAATVLIPFPGALTLPSPHTLRALQLVPMAALLAGIGAVALFRLIWTALDARRSAPGRLAMVIVIVASVGVAGLQLRDQYRNYLVTYPDQIAGSFQDGGLQIAGYVYDQRNDYDRIYFTGLNQTYIYLLFAGPWNADDVHNNLQVRRRPPDFNTVTGLDNVSFTDPPSSLTGTGGQEMYRLPTRGGTTWVATAYTDPNGGRVLVVRPA